MSAALLIRERNPDNDFVLHGTPPLYTERTSFYPTNSDITNTTKNLSQHEYRADLYRDILQDDQNLRSSLRAMSRSLRLVSNNIRKNLEEESTAKKYLQHHSRSSTFQSVDEQDLKGHAESTVPLSQERRNWLLESEWNTSSGHHVAYSGNSPTPTLLNKNPSTPLAEIFRKSQENEREAERLRRMVNVDMDMAEVPLTRFTRKDLMASEYFPVTMSCSVSDESRTPRRSRSKTRSPQRLTKSARMRSRTPDRMLVSDNFRSMKRLEKLYLVTSEAPAIDSKADEVDEEFHIVQTLCTTVELLIQVIGFSTASAPAAILSPYHEEMAHLRMERLRLEEEHLKELNRLRTLERVRGPKPKWYELKDTQFHFEAGKNNDLLRILDRADAARKTQSQELSRSQPDLSTLRARAASFS